MIAHTLSTRLAGVTARLALACFVMGIAMLRLCLTSGPVEEPFWYDTAPTIHLCSLNCRLGCPRPRSCQDPLRVDGRLYTLGRAGTSVLKPIYDTPNMPDPLRPGGERHISTAFLCHASVDQKLTSTL